VLIDYTTNAKKLVWQWKKGAATDLFALGNPVTGATNYSLCTYGSSGGAPALVLSALIPADGICGSAFCWSPTGTRGFQYRDPSGQADGITRVLLRTGGDGKAEVKLQGSGPNLPPIVPSDANHLISQDPVATVQLVNSAGECWESVFPAPATKAGGSLFRDKF
jgi:hypothetical protein